MNLTVSLCTRSSISNNIVHIGRYVPVRQQIGTWTARYWTICTSPSTDQYMDRPLPDGIIYIFVTSPLLPMWGDVADSFYLYIYINKGDIIEFFFTLYIPLGIQYCIVPSEFRNSGMVRYFNPYLRRYLKYALTDIFS